MGTLRTTDTYAQGRFATVFLSLLQTGDLAKPVPQTFMVGGFSATATVVNAVSAASYVLVVGGTTYTVVATATDTVLTIARKLAALINAGTIARAVNVRQVATTAVIQLVRLVTFTLANTGTTTPADLTVTVAASAGTAAAVGATSIGLSNTVIGNIAAGQYLRATQPDGLERTFRVTANVSSGGTLAVSGVQEAIAIGSIIQFPTELFGREQSGFVTPNTTATTKNFNTGGFESPVVTGGSATANLSGDYSAFDPSILTAKENYRNGTFALTIVYPSLKAGWNPEERFAPVVLISNEEPVDVGGFIKCNFSCQAVSDVTTIFSALA
jgi:hypothetical protein